MKRALLLLLLVGCSSAGVPCQTLSWCKGGEVPLVTCSPAGLCSVYNLHARRCDGELETAVVCFSQDVDGGTLISPGLGAP